MLLKKTNIESRLRAFKTKHGNPDLLAQVQKILFDDEQREHRIISTLSAGEPSGPINHFVFDHLDTGNIFHIDQIKTICIDYRLRFLDSKYFKGEIPRKAIEKIKALEKLHSIELKGFKIMAPSKLFKLADKDDPLLFAPIGNDHFYLIHKWGNDLHPFRKLLVWPFRNIVNLTLFTLLVSYFCTLLVPSGLFSKSDSASEFWIIFFFMFKCIASVVIFYGFALGKNFNPAIWKSKYFNA